MEKQEKDKGRFVRVACPGCKSEQVIFGKASQKVLCIKCKTLLAEPSGGKARIKAKIEEVF